MFFMEEPRLMTALIEQQKKITVTGVESVDSFSPEQISLTLDGGRAVIAGEGLKIVDFSKMSGRFAATGTITGIRFGKKKEKLAKRLFG